ncbi:hypothetical protein HY772_04850 [Candidatus Woesearchaeota archaeon]|nr:hypothetical protein [Candidatus Woesearchaeota archaeon]
MELVIASQKLFPGDNNHQNLKKASYSHIIKLKEKFEQGEKQQPEDGKAILVVRWLEAFGRLKQKSEELKRHKVRLNEEEPRLTVYDVMQIMFNRVLYCMFKPEWNESMIPETAPGIDGRGEVTYEATI